MMDEWETRNFTSSDPFRVGIRAESGPSEVILIRKWKSS